MKRPPLLVLLAFALVGVGGLLLLVPQVQAASFGGLPTTRTTMTRQLPHPAHQVRRLGGGGGVGAEDDKSTRLGSRPPICRGKCYECSPCTAVQVPTLATTPLVANSNYKPVGWKCQCRDRLYQP